MSDTSVQPNPDPGHSQPGNGASSSASAAVSDTDHLRESGASVRGATSTTSGFGEGPKRTWLGEIFKTVLSVLILSAGIGTMYGLYLLKEPPKEQVSKELIPMVGTVKATAFSGQLDRVISGTVVPYREIRVAAEVSGNVSKKHESFEAGNFVKKGTLLLEINPKDYELQLATGLAEIEQSQKLLEETQEEIAGAIRNIAGAKDEYDLAKSDHDRNERIKSALSASELAQSKRALLVAESALTTCRNNLDTLNARVKRMESAVKLAEAQLERMKLNLAKTKIVAPDDGIIVQEMVQEGDYVRAGDELVMFEDTSRSEVICDLTPTDLAWVRNNAPSSSEFPPEPDSENAFSVYRLPKTKVSVYEVGTTNTMWEGMMERFDGIGRDASTRTIPCRITVADPIIETDNGPRALVRGMFVKCKIQVQTSVDDSKRSFLSFPSVALRPGNTVWVVRDHKLKRHPVEVVDYSEQLVGNELVKIVIVVAGIEGSIQQGDAVVTTPLAQPSDGTEVILEEEIAGLRKTKTEMKDTDHASGH